MSMRDDYITNLSTVLYWTDPAKTCCVENECEDEYDGIAEVIVESIEAGSTLRKEIIGVLSTYMGVERHEYDLERIIKLFEDFMR